jgi:hypothetical protein
MRNKKVTTFFASTLVGDGSGASTGLERGSSFNLGLSGTSLSLPSPTLPSCDEGLTGAVSLSTPPFRSLTPTDLGLSVSDKGK